MSGNMGNFNPPSREEQLEKQLADQKKAYESQISGLNTQMAGQKSALEAMKSGGASGDSVSQRLKASFVDPNTGSMGDAKNQDLIKGAQFGEAVLGEGLGRLADQEGIQDVLSQQKELAKGMGSKEMIARREQAGAQIDASTQQSSRALQAALARAGVKGGAAGAKLRDVAIGGIAQKAKAEQDLLIQDRAMREKSLGNLAATQQGIAQFDIAQAAKEKNIALQAGLGFAGLGAAERGATEAAAATRAAGQAQAAAACFTEETLIVMQDGSSKPIVDIRIGDETSCGTVLGLFASIVQESLYDIDGIRVTADHPVKIGDEWFFAKDVGIKYLTVGPVYVYDLITASHRIQVEGHTDLFIFSDYEGQDTDSDLWLEACKTEYTRLNG